MAIAVTANRNWQRLALAPKYKQTSSVNDRKSGAYARGLSTHAYFIAALIAERHVTTDFFRTGNGLYQQQPTPVQEPIQSGSQA
jgi:hypothetical protein